MKINSVDEYIANAPKELVSKLTQMRRVIREVIPEAMEKISYGMPFYEYKGRLCYFAYFKDHLGLYLPPPTIQESKLDLTDYVTSKSTVQFSLERKLPVELIKKLIKARKEFNEAL